VDVYVNKVGPFYNPHETYHYYQLPVCRPEKVIQCKCADCWYYFHDRCISKCH